MKSTSSARKIRIRRLALVLASIIGTWAFLGFLATIPVTGNHPYWRTFRARPEDFGLQAENVSFSSQEGILLKGWYIRPHGASHGTVIVAHGINGNRSDMLSRAAILVRHNYGALLIDLRDHGESGGHFTGPGYVESRDILAALKFLRSRGQVGPVAAMGHSYGAVAALYAAADSPDLAAVVADGAFISFRDMVSRATILLSRDPERSFWERFGLRLAGFRGVEWAVKPIYYLRTGIWLSRGETNTLAPISQLGTRPILFISGEKDEICPAQNARVMFDMARSPQKRLLVIPNADHDTTFQTAPHLYESVVIQFLEEALTERKKDVETGHLFRSGCDLDPPIRSRTANCQPKQAGLQSPGSHSVYVSLSRKPDAPVSDFTGAFAKDFRRRTPMRRFANRTTSSLLAYFVAVTTSDVHPDFPLAVFS